MLLDIVVKGNLCWLPLLPRLLLLPWPWLFWALALGFWLVGVSSSGVLFLISRLASATLGASLGHPLWWDLTDIWADMAIFC